jgi:hypothetical protein
MSGRKTKCTPEAADKIIEALELGMTDGDAAIIGGICHDTFIEWRKKHPEFSERAARAAERLGIGAGRHQIRRRARSRLARGRRVSRPHPLALPQKSGNRHRRPWRSSDRHHALRAPGRPRVTIESNECGEPTYPKRSIQRKDAKHDDHSNCLPELAGPSVRD